MKTIPLIRGGRWEPSHWNPSVGKVFVAYNPWISVHGNWGVWVLSASFFLFSAFYWSYYYVLKLVWINKSMMNYERTPFQKLDLPWFSCRVIEVHVCWFLNEYIGPLRCVHCWVGVVEKIRGHNPISCNHASLQCLPFVPHLATHQSNKDVQIIHVYLKPFIPTNIGESWYG